MPNSVMHHVQQSHGMLAERNNSTVTFDTFSDDVTSAFIKTDYRG